MKKLFALLLCLCMVFSFMSFAAAEEKVNLTAIQYALENQQTDFNNLWFFQQVEEKTGVHVDFQVVKDARLGNHDQPDVRFRRISGHDSAQLR